MRRLMVFNSITLDGHFTGANGDLSWAHVQDPEWQAFTAENAKGEAEAIFGRVTYEMMASWWPTPQARQMAPDVAKAMNEMPKVVFSRSLRTADWQNTRVVNSDPADEIRRMKSQSGPQLLLMGSGTIVSQLTEAGLIDEYQIVVHPLVIGKGRSMFETVTKTVPLRRTAERTFKNGRVVLWYEATTS